MRLKLIFIFFIFWSCETNRKNDYDAKIRTTDFPLNEFNKCENKHCQNYVGDTLIELLPGPRYTYMEQHTLKNKFYEKIMYDKNLKITTNGYWFKHAEIGIHNYYDSKGLLKEQINFDDGFTIGIEDLRSICLKKYKIDITDSGDTTEITKELSFLKSNYILVITLGPLYRATVKIDGKTGKIISEEFYDIEG
ncbi:MAG: hypothetical protein M0D53_08875 [Flavobacterium sp. JAD_PAG50586_2]|nr:MAG: hypothetical protein M0D53_08875 [Flavobacterium sp. JAD_PAG50586_2]